MDDLGTIEIGTREPDGTLQLVFNDQAISGALLRNNALGFQVAHVGVICAQLICDAGGARVVEGVLEASDGSLRTFRGGAPARSKVPSTRARTRPRSIGQPVGRARRVRCPQRPARRVGRCRDLCRARFVGAAGCLRRREHGHHRHHARARGGRVPGATGSAQRVQAGRWRAVGGLVGRQADRASRHGATRCLRPPVHPQRLAQLRPRRAGHRLEPRCRRSTASARGQQACFKAVQRGLARRPITGLRLWLCHSAHQPHDAGPGAPNPAA